MIIVNVSVPAIEKVYNFSLEEKAKISDLIEELVELIAQKERLTFMGSLDELALCSVDSGILCGSDHTLSEYGVEGGTELILV